MPKLPGRTWPIRSVRSAFISSPGLSFLYAFRIPSNTSIASHSVIQKSITKPHTETTNAQEKTKTPPILDCGIRRRARHFDKRGALTGFCPPLTCRRSGWRFTVLARSFFRE